MFLFMNIAFMSVIVYDTFIFPTVLKGSISTLPSQQAQPPTTSCRNKSLSIEKLEYFLKCLQLWQKIMTQITTKRYLLDFTTIKTLAIF